MAERSFDQARVKLVASWEGGALFVAAFGDRLIEIRDCQHEDPNAVRASVTVHADHAEALIEALHEARAIDTESMRPR